MDEPTPKAEAAETRTMLKPDDPDINLDQLAHLHAAGLPIEEIAKQLFTTPGSVELAAALLPPPAPPPPAPVPPGGRLLPAPGGEWILVQPTREAR